MIATAARTPDDRSIVEDDYCRYVGFLLQKLNESAALRFLLGRIE